jgi:glutamate synthase domain-containing protein 2
MSELHKPISVIKPGLVNTLPSRWLALILSRVAVVVVSVWGAFWTPALWGLVLFIPLSALGLADLTQTAHTLWRNYPIVSRIRWLFDDLRPYLRAYIVESDLEGRPFSRDERALVYARAKGDEDATPFGTELDVYSGGYEWFSHSIAPTAITGHDFRVQIGGPQCSQPYWASLLNISAMSFGSLGANAIEALNKGAAKGGFYHDTGEGGISPYHTRHGGDLVWEIGSGYFGCRFPEGGFDPERFERRSKDPQVKMIEIKLSQGAKPGHGGMLPGAKVTAEIAATRHVPQGVDCISPAAHSAFSSPREMMQFVARLRELSGGKPVGIKLCVGHPHEVFAVMKAMIETGILLDYIVVDGGEGGTGAAPLELTNNFGAPLKDGLTLVRNALVGAGLREHVRIGAAGKVYSAASIAANCAMGADWSNAARAFMFALGCVQSLRCHVGTCPTGVATQDPSRQRGLVVEDKAERVWRFHQKTMLALAEITRAAGLEHPSEFRDSHLHQHLMGKASSEATVAYPVLEAGSLLADPNATPYAAYWAAAQVDSFRPALKVGSS